MTLYQVMVPVDGFRTYEVGADSAEEAKELVLSGELEPVDYEENGFDEFGMTVYEVNVHGNPIYKEARLDNSM